MKNLSERKIELESSLVYIHKLIDNLLDFLEDSSLDGFGSEIQSLLNKLRSKEANILIEIEDIEDAMVSSHVEKLGAWRNWQTQRFIIAAKNRLGIYCLLVEYHNAWHLI